MCYLPLVVCLRTGVRVVPPSTGVYWVSTTEYVDKEERPVSFSSYDSLEEMLQAMREAEARANAEVQPDQAAIDFGDHWVSVFEDFLIFGRVTPLEELDAESGKLGTAE